MVETATRFFDRRNLLKAHVHNNMKCVAATPIYFGKHTLYLSERRAILQEGGGLVWGRVSECSSIPNKLEILSPAFAHSEDCHATCAPNLVLLKTQQVQL